MVKTKVFSINKGETKNKVRVEYYDDYSDKIESIEVFVPKCGGYVRSCNPPHKYILEAFSEDKKKYNLMKFNQFVECENFIKFIRSEWKKRQRNFLKSPLLNIYV